MSDKDQNKNKDTLHFDLDKLASGIGFVAMSMAAVLSLVELHQARGRLISLAQAVPAYATVTSSSEQFSNNEDLMRREKYESTHSEASYGVTMRSHSTSGAQ